MNRSRQLPANDQRIRLRAYLRTLRANYNRASRELFSTTRIRRGCPIERNLRHLRFTSAYELLKMAESALKEINHCYVLRVAGFRPGDHLLVTTVLAGFDPSPRRYVVLDVIWSKGDTYYYEVQELTKRGLPHKRRYPTWISPSNRISIEYCKDPLPKEAQWLADGRRESAKALLAAILVEGDLSLFQPKSEASLGQPVPQQYPFWLHR